MTMLDIETILESFSGNFWGSVDEMIEDMEEAGLEVVGNFGEYIAIADEDDSEWLVYIGRTGSTVWVSSIKEP